MGTVSEKAFVDNMKKITGLCGIVCAMALINNSLFGEERENRKEQTFSGHSRSFIESLAPGPREITIPLVDLSAEAERHRIIASGKEARQGHPTTLRLPETNTLFVAWTIGHGGPAGPPQQ